LSVLVVVVAVLR